MAFSVFPRICSAFFADGTAFVQTLTDPSGEAVVAEPVAAPVVAATAVAAAPEPVAAPVVADDPVVAAPEPVASPVVDDDPVVAAATPVVDTSVVAATPGSPSRAIKGVLFTRVEYYCSQCPIMEIHVKTVQNIKTHNYDSNMKVFYLSPGYCIYVIRCVEWQCSDHPIINVDYKVLKEGSPFPDFGRSWVGYECTRKVYFYATLVERCAHAAPRRVVLE